MWPKNYPGPQSKHPKMNSWQYACILQIQISKRKLCPRRSWFKQTGIHTTLGCFRYKSQLFWPNDVREDFKRVFFYLFLSKNTISPYCGPTVPPGIIIWTNWNPHYLSMLPHKYQLFWPNVFWKDFLKVPTYVK